MDSVFNLCGLMVVLNRSFASPGYASLPGSGTHLPWKLIHRRLIQRLALESDQPVEYLASPEALAGLFGPSGARLRYGEASQRANRSTPGRG